MKCFIPSLKHLANRTSPRAPANPRKHPQPPPAHENIRAQKRFFSRKSHIVSHVPNLYPESTRYVLSLSQMKRLGNLTQASYQTRSRQYAGFFFSKEKAILRLYGG